METGEILTKYDEEIRENYLEEYKEYKYKLDEEASNLYREQCAEEIEFYTNINPVGKEIW